MQDLLKSDYVYNTLPTPTQWFGSATHFMYDQPKLNMLWLVFPDFDAMRHTKWGGNEYTESINAWMDRETRIKLQGPPGAFLDYWLAIDEVSIPEMASNWPESYIDHMIAKVAEVEARYRAEMPVNIVQVDFKRKSRVA